MKDELGRKIITKFAALRAKKYSYLTDESDENKKGKDRKTDENLNLKIMNIV